MIRIGRPLPPLLSTTDRPDWVEADPRFIAKATERAMAREGGGWCVLDASDRITREPRRMTIAGRELVVYRGASGGVVAAPNACPHMGAELHHGHVEGDRIVCPWHGLALGESGHGRWRCVPIHDDGVLVWAQVIDDETRSAGPIASPRPRRFVAGVVRMEARCEPEDIVANRLDPWHGAHYHPHSFATLQVTDKSVDRIALRVAYRAIGPLVVEVDCTFHAPTRRSIVMTITGGDGVGSVVETHATPLGDGRSAVIEATLASSDRPGFALARRLSPLVRRIIERRAARLWVEDIAYAERRHTLRGQVHPISTPVSAGESDPGRPRLAQRR